MRLVSYNILNGGEGRADPLAEVVAAQRPDIVVLIEADRDDVVERIAARLHMDMAIGLGHRHGTAILSRWPILESIDHAALLPGLSDCLLEITISEPGREWIISAVHLHPGALVTDDAVRQTEIEAILAIYASHRHAGRPHVLAGDFNADSPIQHITPERCKPRTRREFAENGGWIPRLAVAKLLAAGYVDTLHAFLGEQAAEVGSFSTQFPGQRVDHVFTFGIDSASLTEVLVEQDRLARYASDHFPIVVEFG